MKKKLFAVASILLVICCAILPCFAFNKAEANNRERMLIPFSDYYFSTAGTFYNFELNAAGMADNDGDGLVEMASGTMSMYTNPDQYIFNYIAWNVVMNESHDLRYIWYCGNFTLVKPDTLTYPLASHYEFDAIEFGATGLWYHRRVTDEWVRVYTYETNKWTIFSSEEGYPTNGAYSYRFIQFAHGNMLDTSLEDDVNNDGYIDYYEQDILTYIEGNGKIMIDRDQWGSTPYSQELTFFYNTKTNWLSDTLRTSTYTMRPPVASMNIGENTYSAGIYAENFILRHDQNMKFGIESRALQTFATVTVSINYTFIEFDYSEQNKLLRIVHTNDISVTLWDDQLAEVLLGDGDVTYATTSMSIIPWADIDRQIEGTMKSESEPSTYIAINSMSLGFEMGKPAYQLYNGTFDESIDIYLINNDNEHVYDIADYTRATYGSKNEDFTGGDTAEATYKFSSFFSTMWNATIELPIFAEFTLGDAMATLVALGVFIVVLKIFAGG